VEGRHFDLKTISPWQLGAKAMAVNLSDCAAMGAKPAYAVVSLGAPKDFPVKDLEAFYDGLKEWGNSFGAKVVGGDTVGSEKLVVNVALIGEVEKGRALKRSGAKAGDALFLTGTVGDSAAGLHSLQHPSAKGSEAAPLLVKKHLTPLPRFTVGRHLVLKRLATAAIDLSDGLSTALHQLCRESGIGVELHEEGLPLSPSLLHYCSERGLDPLEFALHGGEDYELLFTVPLPKIPEVLRQVPAETGTAVKAVGRMTPKAKGVTLITRKGQRKPLEMKGFDHFKE
jgi:thiamine-monophosphate kinase